MQCRQKIWVYHEKLQFSLKNNEKFAGKNSILETLKSRKIEKITNNVQKLQFFIQINEFLNFSRKKSYFFCRNTYLIIRRHCKFVTFESTFIKYYSIFSFCFASKKNMYPCLSRQCQLLYNAILNKICSTSINPVY